MKPEKQSFYLTSSSAASTIHVKAPIANLMGVSSGEAKAKRYIGDYVALYSQGKLVGTSDTVSFVSKLEEQIKKIARISDEVITSLRRNLDYNGYYISYLLEQLSAEEFAKISEQYAINLVSEESKELIDKVKILFYISSQSYTPSELSTIFKVDEKTAANVVNHLKESKLIDSKDSY